MNILEIKGLSVYYNEKEVLKDVNLNIKENEIICIMGSSGQGKSTFLSAINGFLEEKGGTYEGDIVFDGENIRHIDKLTLRRKISTLFQDAKPFDISIEKNLTYVMEYYGIKNKNEEIRKILEDVNLYNEVKDKLKTSAKRLSGGQKQRLCIGRMLVTKPRVLILDEPFSSLDEENTLFIENLLKKLSKKYTILISTHNKEQARRLADRIVFVRDGDMLESIK